MTDIEPTGTVAGARNPFPGARRRAGARTGSSLPDSLMTVGIVTGAVTVLAAVEIVSGLAGFPLHGLTSLGGGVGYGAEGTGPEGVHAIWRTAEMMLAVTLIGAVGLTLIVASLAPGRDAGSPPAPDGSRPAAVVPRAHAAWAPAAAGELPAPHGATTSYEVGLACGLSPRAARRGADRRERADASGRPEGRDAPTGRATRPDRD